MAKVQAPTPRFPQQNPCPCGSQQAYGDCCGPAIDGNRPVTTAEALMRSRFSAFATAQPTYLFETSHPDFRNGLSPDQPLDQQTRWLQLQILSTEAGQPTDRYGRVHFIATYADAEGFGRLEENSRFEQLDGRWYYLDGELEVKSFKPERNAACPCGSGTKFKRCCGRG
ncbi:zinc chelation protein SecC [Motiliproteus coralliicola]|uniref:Zinc chelation protein SecC n=1 Tax=Motiliproteus coralliicola TaxID=2283196 RepID=A0A369WUC0_9GAMM|nr:YchJ family protein [Motiliproteus coralliicola]RDE24154.1 zinc chelation protein SecC [Motiliproteus coralliicola]